MKKRRSYLIIFRPLMFGVFFLIFWLCGYIVLTQFRTQETFIVTVSLPSSVSLKTGIKDPGIGEELLLQMEKLPGFCRRSVFYGTEARIRIGMYTVQTEIRGVDMEAGLLTPVRSAGKNAAGSSPLLIIGEDFLDGLTDEYGYAISDRQKDILMQELDGLEAEIFVESSGGRSVTDTARFLGTVKEEGVYMDAPLMREWLKKWNLPCRICGAELLIQGEEHARYAEEKLKEAGLTACLSSP